MLKSLGWYERGGDEALRRRRGREGGFENATYAEYGFMAKVCEQSFEPDVYDDARAMRSRIRFERLSVAHGT